MARQESDLWLREREAPRLWQQERDQQLRELEFVYNERSAHLVPKLHSPKSMVYC